MKVFYNQDKIAGTYLYCLVNSYVDILSKQN